MTATPEPAGVARSDDSVRGLGARTIDARDDDAFNQLIASVQSCMFRWALTFATDIDDAEDIVQESSVLLYRRFHQFRSDGDVHAWLYQIVRRVGLARARRGARRNRLTLSAKLQPDHNVYLTDPGARVDRAQFRELVHAYFLELPTRQREVFDLVDLQQYDPAEVAVMTSTNASTVRAHLFKARATIRQKLRASHPHLFTP